MVGKSNGLRVMVSDPIADMLTRLRNAVARRQRQTHVPVSKARTAIAELLKTTHYIRDFQLVPDGRFQQLIVDLKYVDGKSRITGLKRVSKPGLRVYARHDALPQALNGIGIVIMSTCQGIMTARAARKAHLGGEVLALVW